VPTASSQPHARAQNSSAPGLSTIGEDLTVTGDVTSNGEIHVDGHVHGDIHCGSLVLSESSEIEGSVIAENVVIRGRLIGSVRALWVTLQSTSHVEGDLLHKSLAVEQGAYFEGKSHRSEDPLALSQTTPGEGATEPQPVPDCPGRQRGKPKTGFIRSLPESQNG
jgi:cytoskeletal protein CcmA (bactofilin family)